jgi:outer membrane autotransporter protein
MNHMPSSVRRGLLACAFVFVSSAAHADLLDLTYRSPIESAAARANQNVYDRLLVSGCDDNQLVATASCGGSIFDIFASTRELVHTANEITPQGGGPTRFSLGLDQEGLGFALRWTAAEEMSAQGSTATDFSISQLSTLASRVSALRFAAKGSRVGGGAAADDEPSIASRWGVFVDGSFGYGNKEDTSDPANIRPTAGSEDAFDFDGEEFSLGADYRINNNAVIGLLFGHSTRAVDFDSSVSIVDANIESDGKSFMGYFLYETDRAYLTASLGSQWITHEMDRRITYPSLNPLVPSIDYTVTSEADSHAIVASGNFGMTFGWGGFALEPYLKAEYQAIKISSFREQGAGGGFELQVGDQDIDSLDIALGLKAQHVFTPSFGVIIPYVRGEFHLETQSDSRNISTVYAGLGDTLLNDDALDFNLATDEADDQYAVLSAGLSIVLRVGLQGFVQYQQVNGLETFSDRAITGGVRYEF